MNYQIFFMKKLWINTVPGRDKNADIIFYFPQELPKYLRGYHKTSKADLVELAALIYRARFGGDQSLLGQISQMLGDLLPPDMIRIQSNSQWKSLISVAYLKHGIISEDEAKEMFLKRIYQLPTFGTAFFEVKQTSDPSYPELVVVGINKNGVSIIHPQSRVRVMFCIFCKGSVFWYLFTCNHAIPFNLNVNFCMDSHAESQLKVP